MTKTAVPPRSGTSGEARSAGAVPTDSESRAIRVALAGCGTVGGGLVRLLGERAGTIERSRGIRFELARVLVRDPGKPRPEALDPDILTTDLDTFLATDAELVVEAMGGVDGAWRIGASALRQGRTFVTANKSLIADRGPELAAIAREHGGRLFYEAAVAGGVPVIRTLRDALPETGISRVSGILNGTTNYLLTRMAEGTPFAEALAEARDLGYAEEDATRDLDGRDAADKVRILAWLAFGAEPTTLAVHRRGLLPHADRIAADAIAFGGVARLIGECTLEEEGVSGAVEPVIVAPGSAAANTRGADNLIEVETVHNGTIRLSGPGAGGGPTSSALLSDMMQRAVPEPHTDASRPSAAAIRRHVWVLSARCAMNGGNGGGLVTRLRDRGIEPESVQGNGRSGVVRVRTAPVARSDMLEVERALAHSGLDPVLARYEGADSAAG